jgi:subtilisin family serine protease
MMTRRHLLAALAVLAPVVAVSDVQASASSAPVVLVVVDSNAEVPHVYTRSAASEAEAISLESSLEATPGVSVSRRTYLELLDTEPGDPLAASQWALQAIDADAAVALAGDGAGVKVAVIDTGIASHADLVGRVVASKDFVGVPGTNFHGTNVAGIIAATANNGVGVRGVAPGVSLLDARVCMDVSAYGCPSDLIAKGILWAVSEQAAVINLSLGGDFDEAIAAAIAYALSQNVIVVAAAGNTACRHTLTGYNGGEGPNGNCLSTATSSTWPANLDGVVAVGAVLADGSRAPYSSYGPQVALTAPTDVLSTNFIQYGSFGGTSAASPHVAAVAALMRAVNPTLSPSSVKAMLMLSAKRYATPLTHQTWRSCGAYMRDEGYWDACTGLSDTAVPTRHLGGAGFLNALGAVTAARNAARSTWTPAVGSTPDGVTVSFTPVSGASSYDVLIDGETAANTTSTMVTIGGLELGASYAISVRANRQTPLMSSPVLGAPALAPLSAPVVQRADSSLYAGTQLRVTTSSNTALAGSMEVMKVSGVGSWSCWHPAGDVMFQCETLYASNTSDLYRARYVTRYGALGEWSQPFSFNTAYSATLATPELSVSALSNSYLVAITPVVGAARYMFTAGSNWAHISSTGAVLRNAGNDVSCVLEERLLCEVAGDVGILYQVRVAASRDLNPDSGVMSAFSEARRVVITSTTPQFSNLRGSILSSSVYRVRWDSEALRSPTDNVGFDVFSSFGTSVGSNRDADGWYADIPVDARTPDTFDATLVSWRWSEPPGHPAWFSLGQRMSATFVVPALTAPSELVCQVRSTLLGCTFNSDPEMSAALRYAYELRHADNTVLSSGTSGWTSSQITVQNVGADVATVAVRVEEVRSGGRNSAWVLTNPERFAAPTPASPSPLPDAPVLPETPPSVETPSTPPDPLPAQDASYIAPTPTSTTPVVVVPDAVRAAVRGRSVSVKWSKAPRGTTRIIVLRNRRQVASLPASTTRTTLTNLSKGRHSILIVFVKKSGLRSTSGTSITVR